MTGGENSNNDSNSDNTEAGIGEITVVIQNGNQTGNRHGHRNRHKKTAQEIARHTHPSRSALKGRIEYGISWQIKSGMIDEPFASLKQEFKTELRRF